MERPPRRRGEPASQQSTSRPRARSGWPVCAPHGAVARGRDAAACQGARARVRRTAHGSPRDRGSPGPDGCELPAGSRRSFSGAIESGERTFSSTRATRTAVPSWTNSCRWRTTCRRSSGPPSARIRRSSKTSSPPSSETRSPACVRLGWGMRGTRPALRRTGARSSRRWGPSITPCRCSASTEPTARRLPSSSGTRATTRRCGISSFGIHGDYAGVAQAALEQRHPGSAALFVAGCGADVNPKPRGTLELVEAHGTALADAVDRGLQAASPIAPLLRTAYGTVDLPFAGEAARERWRRSSRSKRSTCSATRR